MNLLKRISTTALFLVSAFPALSKNMTFDIIYQNHINVVVADGEITNDTPADFQAFLDTEPFDGFTFYIDLNSPGGSLFGGMELGKIIRQHGLIARVASYEARSGEEQYWWPIWQSGICMSACALAFLGGEDRELDERSTLGFHQFSSAGTASGNVERVDQTERDTQIVSGLVHSYIDSMGISPTLFSRMTLTPPDQMYVPSAVELSALNIIPGKAFTNFTLEPHGEGVVAYSIFNNNVQGLNVVNQVTAYCRGGTPYLLLSQPEQYRPIDQEWSKMAYEELSGFTLWRPPGTPKLHYGPNLLRFRTGGKPVAELEIDARGVEILKGDTKISVEIPSALGRSMYLEIRPSDQDRKALQSAFRLCISNSKTTLAERPSGQSGQDVQELLVGYFNKYLADWSRDNLSALGAMEQAYANQINFYGNIFSKKALLHEKRKFAERWPERNYTSRTDSFKVNCGDTTCVVAAMIDWYAHSSARGKTAQGEAWYELGFDIQTGLIVSESGESRKR